MKAKSLAKVAKLFAAVVAMTVLAVILAACSGGEASDSGSAAEEATEDAQQASDEPIRVGSLKGPTSMGIVWLMDSAEMGQASQNYDFTVAGTADELVPSIVNGELDIALVPANVASILYGRTEGGVEVIDINTLGVLSVVTGNPDIKQFSDLAGQTIIMTGKGTTPQYVMDYLLSQAGIADSVEIDYRSEAPEVVALLNEDPNQIAVLPQPYVSSVLSSDIGVSAVIDLNDVWSEYSDDSNGFVTGVTIVRSEFLQSNPEKVAEFLKGQSQSVNWVNSNTGLAGELVASLGIVANADVATAAIPQSHLVCIIGEEMQSMLENYLNVLFDSDPQSVGGELPGEDFYYLGNE